jgi:hypothetical protein
MKIKFADSPDLVYSAALEVVRTLGKVMTTYISTLTLIGQIKKGVDIAWEPVLVRIQVEVFDGYTALNVVAEQRQIVGLPDRSDQALQVFLEYLTRRKELTRLD